jgi:cation transport regulator ChaC
MRERAMTYYFAYGSNLNMPQMRFRCPGATPKGKILLPKARLMFRGVADIEYHDTAVVPGAIWKITDKDEEALDAYEGVRKSGGLYLKKYITISIDSGEPQKALVYVMNPVHRRSQYTMPHEHYFGSIDHGYANFKLDRKYLLQALKDTQAEIETRRQTLPAHDLEATA